MYEGHKCDDFSEVVRGFGVLRLVKDKEGVRDTLFKLIDEIQK